MTEIRCSGVLFDLDGVLIDSTPAVTRVWRQAEEVVARVHGRPSLATVREYLPKADQAADRTARLSVARCRTRTEALPFPECANCCGSFRRNVGQFGLPARGGLTGSRADRDLYRCDTGQAASRTISEGRRKSLAFAHLSAWWWKMFPPGSTPARRLGPGSSLSAPPSRTQSCGARAPILS